MAMNVCRTSITSPSSLSIELLLIRIFFTIYGPRHRVDEILDSLRSPEVVSHDNVINYLLQRGGCAVQDLSEFKGTDLLRDLPL